MLLQQKTIAIIGGGPGGLTLARLLQLQGLQVKVYERDVNKDARVQGTTLDLHAESGLAALEKAGLMDAFKENYRPGAEKMRIVDNNTTIFFDEHINEHEENFGGHYTRPEIDRGPLRDLLLASLLPGTVVWDSHFLSMEKEGNGWVMHFKNRTNAYADVVIGADGANSKIRPYITSIKPFYSGVTAIEGSVYDAETTVPCMHALLKGGKIFAFGDAKVVIVSSKGDGSLAFYASCRTEEHWVKNSGIDFTDTANVFSWFKTTFTEWSDKWNELLENATTAFISRPIYCAPPDQHWDSLSNITILGDAAHLMPPFAGEGVNMAMQDALELSECLTGQAFTDIPSAIAVYENQMRKRASAAARQSLENTEWMHAPNALNKMLAMFEGV
jgi:2-polyprenyl-6-methoxyphenol hydroxylase-like FAD-dependent oxidoreductase